MSFEIKPLLTQDELLRVNSAAEADNHMLLYPTHYVEVDGQVEGCISVCRTPVLGFWFNSKAKKPLTVAKVYNHAEFLVQAAGFGSVITPCAKDSPLNKFMSRTGYKELGDTTFYFKNFLNQSFK